MSHLDRVKYDSVKLASCVAAALCAYINKEETSVKRRMWNMAT